MLRNECNWSYSRIGENLGVDKQTVSNWLNAPGVELSTPGTDDGEEGEEEAVAASAPSPPSAASSVESAGDWLRQGVVELQQLPARLVDHGDEVRTGVADLRVSQQVDDILQ
jgi:hypothetical protein